jgi:2,3,4,5-tetrahydropyridine-2-carboxylate N-succinyltransferase
VVEAGLYLTAGTRVTVHAARVAAGEPKVLKALELAGASNVLFRRNSVTGAVEAVPWQGEGIELNAALHAN